LGSGEDDRLRAEVLAPITSPDLHRLYDYWQSRRRDGRLPARADIDPLDVPYMLGSLVLFDVLREPLRFRYRLIGSKLIGARHRGPDITGKLIDDHPDVEFRKQAAANLARVATTGRPVAIHRDGVLDGRVRRNDTLCLPLASDGAAVDVILVGQRDLPARPPPGAS
jgi:hypothetical protein